jgi:hypothetical protein
MRGLFFVLVLGCVITACNLPSPSAQSGSVQPTTPARSIRVTSSDQLPELLGRTVELHGVAGLGKSGEYVLVDGEEVDFHIEPSLFREADDFGKPMVARGVLRHTGPIEPPPGCEAEDPCPIQSAMETFFLEDASVEFVNEPPPALASQVGKWVLVRGTLEIGKAGPLIVTEVGPVYVEDDVNPNLKDRIGARAYIGGTLERVSNTPQIDGEGQVPRVADYYVIREQQIRFVDRHYREP